MVFHWAGKGCGFETSAMVIQMLKNLFYNWFSCWPRMQDNGVKRRFYLEEEVAGCNWIDC